MLTSLFLFSLILNVYTQTILNAVVVLSSTSGNTAVGTVYFQTQAMMTLVSGSVAGLAPYTTHGFHVHQWGFIGTPDGTGTGGHWNPTNVSHSCPPTNPRHIGDLGNILSDANGEVKIEKIFSQTELPLNGPNSIIGRGFIVHADPDDCMTQPTGNAGKRIAQGVVGIGPN